MPRRRCSTSRLRVARGVSRGDRPVFLALRGVRPAEASRSQGPNRRRPLKGTRPPVYRREAGLGRHRTYSWLEIARRRGRARPARPSVVQFGEPPRTTPSQLPVGHRSWSPNGGAGQLNWLALWGGREGCRCTQALSGRVPRGCCTGSEEPRSGRDGRAGGCRLRSARDDAVEVDAPGGHRRRNQARNVQPGKCGTTRSTSADQAVGAGERGPASGRRLPVAGESPGKKIYPLVKELAVVAARRGCATGDQVATSTLPHRRPVRVPG